MSGPRIAIEDPDRVAALVESSSEEVKTHVERIKAGLRSIPWRADDTVDWESGHKPRMLALLPEVFDLWWLEDYRVVKNGLVEPTTKELLGVLVADGIECASCVPYHAGAARAEGASDDDIAIVRAFDDRMHELPESRRVALEFGRKAVYDPTAVTDDDVTALKDAGYADAAIVELAMSAYLAYRHAAINRVLNLGQE